MDWLKRSPETTYCGIAAFIGLLVMLLGLAFDEDEVWKAGMGIIGAATTLGLTFARSQRQHEADKPILKAEVAEDVKEEVRQEARDIARKEAQDIVHDITRR